VSGNRDHPQQRGGFRCHRVPPREIGGDLDLDPLQTTGREIETHNLAHGQALCVDPDFALARHVHVLLDHVQVHAHREFAFALQFGFHLVAHVLGKSRAVQVKGMAGKAEPAEVFWPRRCHVPGCHQVSQQVLIRREEAREVIHLFPGALAHAARDLAIFNLDRKGVLLGADVASIRPELHLQHLGRQISLTFEVDALLGAAQTHVFQPGQRPGGLDDTGAITIHPNLSRLLPGSLHLSLGRGAGRGRQG